MESHRLGSNLPTGPDIAPDGCLPSRANPARADAATAPRGPSARARAAAAANLRRHASLGANTRALFSACAFGGSPTRPETAEAVTTDATDDTTTDTTTDTTDTTDTTTDTTDTTDTRACESFSAASATAAAHGVSDVSSCALRTPRRLSRPSRRHPGTRERVRLGILNPGASIHTPPTRCPMPSSSPSRHRRLRRGPRRRVCGGARDERAREARRAPPERDRNTREPRVARRPSPPRVPSRGCSGSAKATSTAASAASRAATAAAPPRKSAPVVAAPSTRRRRRLDATSRASSSPSRGGTAGGPSRAL